jgi:hypothetical protein
MKSGKAQWAILLAWSFIVLSALFRTPPATWTLPYWFAFVLGVIPLLAAGLKLRRRRKALTAALVILCVMSTPIAYADSANCYYTFAVVFMCWQSWVPWSFIAGFATCLPMAIAVPSPACDNSYVVEAR